MPARGKGDRQLAAGEDRVLRLRSEPGPDPRRGGQRRYRGPGSLERRAADRRRDGRRARRTLGRLHGRAGQARDEARGDRDDGDAGPRRRDGDRVDLRLLLRLCEDQRRLPELTWPPTRAARLRTWRTTTRSGT